MTGKTLCHMTQIIAQKRIPLLKSFVKVQIWVQIFCWSLFAGGGRRVGSKFYHSRWGHPAPRIPIPSDQPKLPPAIIIIWLDNHDDANLIFVADYIRWRKNASSSSFALSRSSHTSYLSVFSRTKNLHMIEFLQQHSPRQIWGLHHRGCPIFAGGSFWYAPGPRSSLPSPSASQSGAAQRGRWSESPPGCPASCPGLRKQGAAANIFSNFACFVLNWLCLISRDLLFTLIEMIASSFLYMDCTTRSSPSITFKVQENIFAKGFFGRVSPLSSSTHLIFSDPKDKSWVVVDHCPILQLSLSRALSDWYNLDGPLL